MSEGKVKALKNDGALQVILDLQELAPKIKQIIVVYYNDDGEMIIRRSSMLLKDQSHMVNYLQADTLHRLMTYTRYVKR